MGEVKGTAISYQVVREGPFNGWGDIEGGICVEMWGKPVAGRLGQSEGVNVLGTKGREAGWGWGRGECRALWAIMSTAAFSPNEARSRWRAWRRIGWLAFRLSRSGFLLSIDHRDGPCKPADGEADAATAICEMPRRGKILTRSQRNSQQNLLLPRLDFMREKIYDFLAWGKGRLKVPCTKKGKTVRGKDLQEDREIKSWFWTCLIDMTVEMLSRQLVCETQASGRETDWRYKFGTHQGINVD